MGSAERENLAQQQANLLRALVGGGPVPQGFDAKRLQLAARSLINKRLREVALAWPGLSQALGEEYSPAFRSFAQATPPPAEGGPLADGYRFLLTLPAEKLTDTLRLACFHLRLQRYLTGQGLRLRRWPTLQVGWLRHGRVLLLGVNWPGLGQWLWGTPLPRFSSKRGS